LRCPDCGEPLEVFTVVSDETDVSGPAEFVLSDRQRRDIWPQAFWVRVMQRIVEQELTIDPRLLAEAVLPYMLAPAPPPGQEMPQPRARPGRPSEPAYAVDAEEFAARVMINIRQLEKDGVRVNKPRLAHQLNMSLSTLNRYCTYYRLDYWELVRQARSR
jgi:hypothetical protein